MSCVKELEEHREALQSDRERGFGFFVWVCKRFSIHLSGKKIELKTDHKLVERITSPASKRIEKWEYRTVIS